MHQQLGGGHSTTRRRFGAPDVAALKVSRFTPCLAFERRGGCEF
jgi:hypothetical protein